LRSAQEKPDHHGPCRGRPSRHDCQARPHESDTGSADVQVALLTKRINSSPSTCALKHDNHSRRGLLKWLGTAADCSTTLSRTEHERYVKLIADLGLR
jgi:small subunit ribosomal protein S15